MTCFCGARIKVLRNSKRRPSRADLRSSPYHLRPPSLKLRMRMRELASARIRYGYRKIRVLLNREGWKVGKKLVVAAQR